MPLMMRTPQAIQMRHYISLGGSLPTVGPRSHRALKERATEPHAVVDYCKAWVSALRVLIVAASAVVLTTLIRTRNAMVQRSREKYPLST
jgi:hypothetical protein